MEWILSQKKEAPCLKLVNLSPVKDIPRSVYETIRNQLPSVVKYHLQSSAASPLDLPSTFKDNACTSTRKKNLQHPAHV